MKKLLGTSVLVAALLSASALALEQGPFTAEQARSGRALYVANCAACHGPELKGAGEAPPLAGGTFMAAWGNRSTNEFYNLIKNSMPYGNGNSLDPIVYKNIVASILSINGATPGNNPF
ncbi:MAG: cytochrome c, partial [Acidobacteria bacterium]|nr:cytochrome c [Acidobacteriota bacterium]